MSSDFLLGKTFYVMRHAETDDNLKKIASGSGREAQLTENGKGQAISAGDIVEKLENKITNVVTSAMQRTQETGKIVCDRDSLRHIPHSVDKGINERVYGAMEGFSEKRRREFKKVGGVVDGEESKENLRERTVGAIKQNLEDGKTPLFVTHGGNVLRMVGEALGGERVIDAIKKKGRVAGNCALYEFITPAKNGEKWQVNLLTLDKDKQVERSPVG
ncbi:MAG: histidine phosphatase family protein [Rickettsiales bacterium]